MKLKKIIISGAPGTGKSSIIKELKEKGYYCFDEVWNKKYKNPTNKSNMNDIDEFSKHIFNERLKQLHFNNFNNIKENIIFYDRSIVDTISYLKHYNKEIIPLWKKKCSKYRYNNIVFFCPIWKDIYTQNETRKEDFEESKKIEKTLIKTYNEFSYELRILPKIKISKRVNFIFNNL